MGFWPRMERALCTHFYIIWGSISHAVSEADPIYRGTAIYPELSVQSFFLVPPIPAPKQYSRIYRYFAHPRYAHLGDTCHIPPRPLDRVYTGAISPLGLFCDSAPAHGDVLKYGEIDFKYISICFKKISHHIDIIVNKEI